MKATCKTLGWVMVIALAVGGSAEAKQGYGTLSGVVLDPAGTPQMGATVLVISEDLGGRTVSRLLSNQYGKFFTDHVNPGKYAVRVALAGYLPALEQHVAVIADLTTVLSVQMNSVFASLDTLRHKPDSSTEPDDWKWVLRSSAATRTILQWRDADASYGINGGPEIPATERQHGIVQVTNGSLRLGSPSSLPDAPATAVSYDQPLGNMGRVLLAGQMSYLRGASGAFAGVWLPSGTAERGPETVFVLHQTKFGETGPMFLEMRLDHSEQIALTDRLSLRAGAEYLRVGVESSTSTLRPHAQIDAVLGPTWTASFTVASDTPAANWGHQQALESAIAELDSLPAVLFHNGNPVLDRGWHEEFSIRHKLPENARLEVAVFHDSAKHQAILGSGPAAVPDFTQNLFSAAFLYDGGSTSSWGTRVAYRQKISDHLEFAALYDWAGALSPVGELNPTSTDFHNNLATRNHQSVAASVSGKLPRARTQVGASYKWIAGTTLSRLDAFGEAQNNMDPNLHLSIRQPLPGLNGRWQALVDFSNLLAQGYVSANGTDSRIVLAPVARAFRGGVSFQF
jgi:Carboxypeptidase regulatory-like domain